MGCHSCWNHFRKQLLLKERHSRAREHRIKKRTRELKKCGHKFGTSIWLACKEEWDAETTK